MIIVDDIQQNTEEWFKLKCGVPSASNASRILTNDGKPSKQQSGYLDELVAERLKGKQEEKYKSIDMLNGNETEPEARDTFSFIQRVKLKQVAVIYKDEQKKFLCSPDSLVSPLSKKEGLEIKCVLGKTQVRRLIDNVLPPEYFSQCQFSLYVTDFKYWWWMSYSAGLRSLIIKVKRDEAYIKALAIELELFCEQLDEITNKLK